MAAQGRSTPSSEITSSHVYDLGRGVAEDVARLLKERNQTLAVAESVTGGLLAAMLTDISGSTKFFAGGVVANSQCSKGYLLGMTGPCFEDYQPLSREYVGTIAAAARLQCRADFGIAASGFATHMNPEILGRISFACAYWDNKNKQDAVEFQVHTMPGKQRHEIRIQAAEKAMEFLRQELRKRPTSIGERG